MDRILKIDSLGLEWHWALFAFNIISIFFKNNIMEKTKICSIKNIWTAATVFSQSDTCMAAPDER